MATPRDPAVPAAPTEAPDNTTQPAAGSSSAGAHNVAGDAEPSAATGQAPSTDDETREPLADDAAAVAVATTPTSEDSSVDAATRDESPETHISSDRGYREHMETEIYEQGDEDEVPRIAENTSAGEMALPIRTSSARAASESHPLQTEWLNPDSQPSPLSQSSESQAQFIGPDGEAVDLGTLLYPLRSRQSPGRRSSLRRQLSPPRERRNRDRRDRPEFALPRWQPDAEVTLCPICNTQFSIWVRKHHCRKCGRVVCSSCSPHRITIPNQYIVRPPESEISFATSLFADPMTATYPEPYRGPGGERVRLCNPCVPDPNTAPPQSPTPHSPRSTHHRSRSSLSNAYTGMPPAPGRYTGLAGALQALNDTPQYHGPRTRSIALNPPGRGLDPVPTSSRSASYQTPFERYMMVRPSNGSSSQFTTRPGLFDDAGTSSRHRALPPTPQIAEEDECPVCHRELPSTTLPDFETLREQHITACIQSHSTYGSPAPGDGAPAPPPVPRRTGMYTYAATEKDCVDDAECTICLEEFAVGVPMARLECLCRFHRACIAAWFVNHPGRCPVHQHDGFGF